MAIGHWVELETVLADSGTGPFWRRSCSIGNAVQKRRPIPTPTVNGDCHDPVYRRACTPTHRRACPGANPPHNTEERVAGIAAAGRESINRRLAELDYEWDIERTLEANAATLIAAGAGLALLTDRRFAFVPLVVGSFLLQHAVQGWCPPLPVFRRLGIRTQSEIDYERYALKSLRGDFRNLPSSPGDKASAKEAVDTMRR